MNLCALCYIQHVFDQYCLLKILSVFPVCTSVLFFFNQKSGFYRSVDLFLGFHVYSADKERLLKYAAVDSNGELSFFFFFGFL